MAGAAKIPVSTALALICGTRAPLPDPRGLRAPRGPLTQYDLHLPTSYDPARGPALAARSFCRCTCFSVVESFHDLRARIVATDYQNGGPRPTQRHATHVATSSKAFHGSSGLQRAHLRIFDGRDDRPASVYVIP